MRSSDPRRIPGDPIAVVGMDCIFPGARDLAAYWSNIVRGVDAIRKVSSSRWNGLDFDLATLHGGFIDGLTEFDPLPFGIMPTSVEQGDPEQFLVLSVIHRALVDAQRWRQRRRAHESLSIDDSPVSDGSATAGHWLGVSPERTEVVIGRGGYLGNVAELGYLRMEVVAQVTDLLTRLSPGLSKEQAGEVRRLLLDALPPVNSETTASAIPNLTSGRVTNRMGFMGSNYTVDAACASALVALDNVIRSLREHRCDLGIAAGVHLVQKPHFWLAFETLSALSRTGRLRAFAAGADGLVIGEGLGAVVLKRLSDAERDGDHVYAIVRGIGVASDGRGAGLMTPRVEGEVLAMRWAYEDAGVDPESITLIEGHGTGTPVGDATEIAALHQIFGRDGYPAVALGSVKSMIGHTMPAAGMAGFIKAVLALYHRVLPPTLHAERPHPDLEGSRIYVNSTTRPWISSPDTPRRAGVNAFGFGGINCHVILEEHADESIVASLTPQSSELFLATADTRADLLESIAVWAAAALDDNNLRDVAFAECLRFSHRHPVRMAIIATSMSDLRAKLTQAQDRLQSNADDSWSDPCGIYFNASPCPGRVAFLFPGIGFPGLAGGYTERLAELCIHFPEVRRNLDFANGLSSADGIPHPLGYQFFPPPSLDSAARASIERELAWSDRTPTGMMTVNHVTWSLLRSMGFHPDVIAGFSLGEWSALWAAGVLDFEGLMHFKSILKEDADPHGLGLEGTWAMIAASADQVETILHQIPGTVTLTMDVSPTQVFIGGEIDAVRAALQRLREVGVWGQELPFPPIHTPLGTRLVERLKSRQSVLRVNPPAYPLYSGMSGRLYPDDPSRILDVISESLALPIRIRDTILELYREGVRIFVQLGSGGKLLTNIQNTLVLDPHVALSIDVEQRGGLEQLHHLIGRLAVLGVPFVPEALYRHRVCRRVDAGSRQSSQAGDRLLRLDPPRLRPSEEAIERIRRIVISTPLPPHSRTRDGDAPRPSPGQPGGVFEESLGMLARFLEVQHQWEEREARLLGRYLEIQEEALTSFLSGAPGASPEKQSVALLMPGAPPDGSVAEVGHADSSAIPGAHLSYPLIGEVLHLIPGQELRSRLLLDLDAHPFLADHTFIHVPASLKPPEALLPTLPLTVGVEILAEAAAALVPDLAVLACHDVEATRWISLKDTRTLHIDITARRASDTEVGVELYTEGKEQAALHGAVTLGAVCPPPPQPMTLSYDQACPHTAEQLYNQGLMFQGPRYQVVAVLRGMSQNSIAAELVLRDPQELFATPLTAKPIFDPVLLDGLGQVLGYKAQLEGWAVLPVRIERVALHGSAPPAGSTVHAAIHYRRADARRVEGDIDVFDPAGKLWLRVEGWGTWRLLWPKSLQEFTWQPRERTVAAPWPVGDARVRCYRMTPDLLGEMNPDWIARTYLTGEDWVRYQERPPLGWFFGRIAVNDAIRDWLRRRRERSLHPLEVKITNLPDGAPIIAAPPGVRLAISLSHIDDEAVAVVAEAQAVGIDLVRVAERGPEFLDLGFNHEERETIAAAGGDGQLWIHRAWSAKEAAAKAHGLGFAALPRFRVRRIAAQDGIVEIESLVTGSVLSVKTFVHQERVMAIAVID